MINLSNRQWFSVVCTLIDNGKLADQVAKFLPVLVKKIFLDVLVCSGLVKIRRCS